MTGSPTTGPRPRPPRGGAATRVLIMGAGSAAGENLIRSLRAADPSLALLGGNDDRFVLKRSLADARYLLPSPRTPAFVGGLVRLVGERHVDVVVPTSDAHVDALSAGRGRAGGAGVRTPPPAGSRCRDK